MHVIYVYLIYVPEEVLTAQLENLFAIRNCLVTCTRNLNFITNLKPAPIQINKIVYILYTCVFY